METVQGGFQGTAQHAMNDGRNSRHKLLLPDMDTY